MAIVTNFNGTEDGTDGEMVKYSFSGSPAGQLFEHTPKVGEVRVMSVQVECTAQGDKATKDGSLPVASWKVTNAQLGREVVVVKKPDTDEDPDQISIDDVEDSAGDYGDDTSDPVADPEEVDPVDPDSLIAGPTDIFSNR